MNNPSIPLNQQPDSFTEGVEQLYHELELAVMWQQPSLLFAIFNSESTRREAEALLSSRIAVLKQKISTILLDDIDDINNLPSVILGPDAKKTIFFIRGLIWDCSQNSVELYKEINKHQDLFTDNSIRVVFWVREKELTNLTACAPAYWNFRHRAVDLTNTSHIHQIAEIETASEEVKDEEGKKEPETVNTTASIKVEQPLSENTVSSDGKVAENANFLLMLGISNWRENKFQKALDYILVALETSKLLDDQSFKAQCYHALALVKTGLKKYEEAIDAYEQAVSLAPGKIVPWDNLGQLYCKLRRPQEAIKAYEKALEHNPEDPFGWNGLGNAYAEIGLLQNAIAAYQKALKISPDFANAYIGQGDVYAGQGSWGDAISSYQHATQINPRLLEPWINLGNVLQKKEQYERAIHAYRNALAVDPTIVSVWNELGNAYLKINACEEAIEAYQKVVELNPSFGWPYANLAYANFINENYSTAIELFEKSIELLDDEATKAVSWNRLGDSYRQLRDYENALKAYQTADLIANGKKDAAKRKSNVSMAKPISTSNTEEENIPRLEEKQKSLMTFRVDIEDSSKKVDDSDSSGNLEDLIEDANHWNTRGHKYLQSGSYDEAIKAYKKAIELSPSSVWAYLDNLALAFYRKGQYQAQTPQAVQGNSEVWGNDNLLEFISNSPEGSQEPDHRNSIIERLDLMIDNAPITMDAKA